MVPVDRFEVMIMRVPSNPGGGATQWQLGDIIHLRPIQEGVPLPTTGTTSARLSRLLVINAGLSDLQWTTLRDTVQEDYYDTDEDLITSDAPLPAQLGRRRWYVTFDSADYADLPPPKRAFMDALVAELTNSPFGAIRDYKDVKQVVMKNKRNGNRAG